MATGATETLQTPTRSWLAWSGLLLAAYFVVSFLAWNRTLGDTEIWSLYYAARPFHHHLQAIREDLVHPPLMYLIERLWLSNFGNSDGSAKALALIVNIPTFFLFPWLASRVTRHWRLASFLFLSVYLAAGSSPNGVRMYGLGLLLAVAVIVFWMKWQERPTNGRFLLGFFLMALLAYTHLFGSLVIAGLLAVNWLYGRRRWAFSLAAFSAWAALLPWGLYILPVYSARGLHPNLTWVNVYPTLALAQLPFGFMGEFIGPRWVRLLLMGLAALLNLALFLLAWRAIRRLWPPHSETGRDGRWFWTAAVLAGVPVLLLFLFSVLVVPAFHPRFVLGALPAYWLLVTLLGELGGRGGQALLYGAFVPWVVLAAAFALGQARTPSTARQSALLLQRELRTDDLVLCQGISLANELYWEMTHRLGQSARMRILPPPPEVARLSVLPSADPASVADTDVSRVWFFYDEEDNPRPVIEGLRIEGFELQRRFPEEKPFLLQFSRATGEPLGIKANEEKGRQSPP